MGIKSMTGVTMCQTERSHSLLLRW